MECLECCMKFTRLSGYRSHMRFIHDVITEYKCSECHKMFNSSKTFATHKKQHLPIKKSATCPLCKEQLIHKELLTHISNVHGATIDTEELSFSCSEDFQKWKSKIEEETFSLFVAARGEKATSEGCLKTYVCHRNGFYVPRGKDKRHLKVMGSNKINANCPAKLSVKTSAKGVKVFFTKTHLGHSCDIDRLHLTKEEKDAIAQKIAAKIPFDDILEDIRESLYDGKLSRQHLINKKDLYNICYSYNLNKVINHQNDSINFDAWVRKMGESKNLVRGYKPQGRRDSEYPELKEGDFFLIIANDTQIEMLKSFGNECVCIDSTHGLNAYDIELYTIMVLDDMHHGFPCAFLFSNRGDTLVLKTFFKTILNALGSSIEPKIFMSDISEIFYSAWCSIMPHENTKRLHCSWHILRVWKNNLGRIKGKDRQIEVFHQLVVLLEELDVNTFNEMKILLLSEWYIKEDTHDFAKYIEHFFNNPSSWAYCFRLYFSVNSNMALESMHKVITHLYLKGKKEKRLDLGIHALTRYLKDKIYVRNIASHKGELIHKLADLHSRHKAAMTLPTHYVLELNGVWKIPSSHDPFEFYDVTVNKEDCTCNVRCNECCVCIHYLSCTCLDNSLKWNMCKHSHLVALILKQRREADHVEAASTNPVSHLSPNTCDVEIESDLAIQEVSENSCGSLEEEKKHLHSKFVHCLDLVTSRKELEALKKIIAPAEHVVRSLKGESHEFPPIPPLTPINKFIPRNNANSTKKRKRIVL